MWSGQAVLRKMDFESSKKVLTKMLKLLGCFAMFGAVSIEGVD
jgi:hypothetical protein